MNIFGHGLSAGGRRYSGVLIVMALLFCWMTVSSAVRAEGLDRIESLIVAGKHSQALDQLQPLLARRPVDAVPGIFEALRKRTHQCKVHYLPTLVYSVLC